MRPNLEEVLSKGAIKALLVLFWGLVLGLSVLAYVKYPGQGFTYILFTIVSNLLLYFGFRKNAIFFDTFLGIFFWLGFWLKLTIRVAFSSGVFHESVGFFDGSGAAFDRALLVASCGLSGFLLASYLKGKLFFVYPAKIEGIVHKGLFCLYSNNRKFIWMVFVFFTVAVAITNVHLGIYQRGCITRTILPFGLNGVYKWLLQFGLASISTLILRYELEIRKQTFLPAMLLGFLETLVSNVSLLSRGMILNGGALMYGVLASLKQYTIKFNMLFFLLSGLIFSVFFIGSVFSVNYLRSTAFEDYLAEDEHVIVAHSMTKPLFIDRWVGMEGVMAVSSYPDLSWDLWKAALQETYNENETSFYDNNLITSPYAKTDKTKHHFISLPGIVAFFFYPGSFLFLFASMFALGSVAALVEAFVFRVGGKNMILCALIAQVVAFRFASFGYVPKQSYLLFGAILLNVLIFYAADKFLARFYRKSMSIRTD
ncbi:hypothetical protein [Methylotuvimicrobium sp. KM1]|uniref:hypothetical protein n=1 Tax=Methylotuvimicrobium sp. KM1 TaxID=3377707 RepID=UPI00384AF450